ncbi:MAG: hypothetical protein ACKO0Z_06980 [Betaproteobacteria bacterium]
MSKTIKLGEKIMFEFGEYSDFGYNGPHVAVRDFDTGEAIAEYEAFLASDHGKKRSDAPTAFITFLEDNNYVVSHENVHTWYLGGHTFSPDWK